VLIVDGSGRAMPEKAICCVDERAALTAFCDRVREFDPDVFTGWNTIDFDFTVLQRIATRLRHPFILGRDAGEIRIRRAEGYFGSGQATIPADWCSMASTCFVAPSSDGRLLPRCRGA